MMGKNMQVDGLLANTLAKLKERREQWAIKVETQSEDLVLLSVLQEVQTRSMVTSSTQAFTGVWEGWPWNACVPELTPC